MAFTSKHEGTTVTEWKFAGLKIKGDFKIKRGNIFVKYKSGLTKPSQNAINGPTGNSSLFVELNKNQQLFEITYQTDQKTTKDIPGINKIPLLGSLFSTVEESHTQKTILCFLTVTEKK